MYLFTYVCVCKVGWRGSTGNGSEKIDNPIMGVIGEAKGRGSDV